jgi:hypothetical protein
VGKTVGQRESVCRWFAGELAHLRLQAGGPTYTRLEELSEEEPDLKTLYRSTTHDILQGKYSRIPSWEWTYSYITVCQLHATKNRIRLDQLADVTEWLRRWYAAMRACSDTAPWPVITADLAEEPPGQTSLTGEQEPARRAMLALAEHSQALGWWHEFAEVVPEWFTVYLSLERAAHAILRAPIRARPPPDRGLRSGRPPTDPPGNGHRSPRCAADAPPADLTPTRAGQIMGDH